MILNLWPFSIIPMEASIRERLQCLEFNLRQSSTGDFRRSDYEQWLRDAHIELPGNNTLYLDLIRYRDMHDDIDYGEGKRKIVLLPDATRDACRWFLGEPWANYSAQISGHKSRETEHPLRPRIYSSSARCILLAWTHQQEVEIPYLSVSSTSFRSHRGIPVGVLPGTDSAYIRLWRRDGSVMNMDMARIQGLVKWTHSETDDYRPPIDDPMKTLQISVTNKELMGRLANQFPGLNLQSPTTATLKAPQSQCLMLADLLESWLNRHSVSKRQVDRSLSLNENTRMDVRMWDS